MHHTVAMPMLHRAPQALKLVAYLFLIEGLLAMSTMVVAATNGNFTINLFAICVPVGWGLLCLNPRSYRWACGICTFQMLMALPAFFLMVLSVITDSRIGSILPLPLNLKVGGSILLWIVGTSLVAWQFNVLHTPPVISVFEPRAEEQPELS